MQNKVIEYNFNTIFYFQLYVKKYSFMIKINICVQSIILVCTNTIIKN